MQAVTTLTQRAVLFDEGKLAFDGPTRSSVSEYRGLCQTVSFGEYSSPAKSEGIIRAKVVTSEPRQVHRFGEPLTLEFDVLFDEAPHEGALSFQIVDDTMRAIVYLSLFDTRQKWTRAGVVRVRCVVPSPRLYKGKYTLAGYLGDRSTMREIDRVENICSFEVVMDSIASDYGWHPNACTYLEDGDWEVL